MTSLHLDCQEFQKVITDPSQKANSGGLANWVSNENSSDSHDSHALATPDYQLGLAVKEQVKRIFVHWGDNLVVKVLV